METPDSRFQSNSSSPERSLSRVLKSRRNRTQTDDNSVFSADSNNSLSVDRGSLLRSSIDRGINKLGRRRSIQTERSGASSEGERRNSHDSSGSGKKITKILSSTSRRLRRKKSDEDGDGSPVLRHAKTVAVDGSDAYATNIENLSAESVGKRSINSSLLTDDSDPEPITRPPLESRDSHTNLLTFSSPLITTETIQAKSPLIDQTDPDLGAQDPKRKAVKVPQIDITEADTTSGLGISADSNSRSPSAPPPPAKDSIQQPSSGGLGSFGNLFSIARKPTASASISGPSPTADEKAAARRLTLPPLPVTDIPTTVITPASPDLSSTQFPQNQKVKSLSSPNFPPITHRRVKSAAAGPTRLSTSSRPPLTPAVEEVSTPGGSLVQASQSAGFFSSVFSATQTASNQFTNFFSTTSSGSRSRSGTNPSQTERTGPAGGEEVIFPGQDNANSVASVPKEPAVATLGSGSLSLSHLGISEPSSATSMTSQEDLMEKAMGSSTSLPVDRSSSPPKTEQTAAAEAVAAAYSETPAKASSVYLDQINNGNRPPSRGSGIGPTADETPPLSLINGKEGPNIRRSGSVRSKLSDKRKRHRGSSGATGGAIAAALASSHSVIANPSGPKPRMTGFPVANAKRNKDFHALFKSVPDDDFLVEDYSAALQREILLHGRLYVSERHLCFSSNIMGYVTTLVVGFDEVVSLEKKNTAVIFPNAIVVQTLHAKNTFASLINREGTYDMVLSIWKLKHPNIKATELGHTLDNTASENKIEEEESESTSEDDDGEYDEDDESGSDVGTNSVSVVGSDPTEKPSGARAVSGAVTPAANGTVSKVLPPETALGETGSADCPGPATHVPTECTDSDTHFEKTVLDDTVPAPLGKIYSMLFGPLSGVYVRKFLETQESTDIQYEDDKKGMDETIKTFSYSYIKKLTASLGPRQTKCLVSQTLDVFDLERSVSVTCSTQTPDVPSGNVFVTKTRYCLTWGPSNSTRIVMSSCVEWSGKSWVKGPIEKGAEGGQAQHGKDLVIFLRSQIGSKSPTKSGKSSNKKKKKRSIGSSESGVKAQKQAKRGATDAGSGWGPLEPLHSVLQPIGDIIGPLVNSTVVLSVLLSIVTILWLRSSYRDPSEASMVRAANRRPERLAAYGELWQREEGELWNWLDQRLQLDDLYGANPSKDVYSSQQVVNVKSSQDRSSGMDRRQIDEAIRVTEEKLAALKSVVERQRDV